MLFPKLLYNETNMRHVAPLLLAITIAVAGCGGGGASQNSAGPDQIYGPFQTRAAGGKPQVLSASISGPTITGIAGAAFTKITYLPQPNVSNSRLAYVRTYSALYTIYIANFDGSNPKPIASGQTIGHISWSRDGRLAFHAYDVVSGKYQIFVVNADGSNLHKISNGSGFEDQDPAWAPDNFHIAFDRFTSRPQIFTMTSSGGSVTNVDDGTSDDTIPAWSPDSTQILFGRYSGGVKSICRVASTGGTVTALTTSQSYSQPAEAPNGAYFIAMNDSGSFEHLDLLSFSNFSYGSIGSTSGPMNDYLPSFSPDGNHILFTQSQSGTTGLVSTTPDGLNLTPIGPQDNSVICAAWEPFPTAIPYVSTSGGYVVYNASSGFLYGLNGSQLTSFLNFTATTPTSATLTVDPITNGSTNITYHIHADALTSIRFVNGFGGAVTIASLGSAQQAIVSFNTTDGSVASVLAVASKKTAANTHHLGLSTYAGSFAAVYNSKGVNLAPHGASEVTLNKNGEVQSVK